MLLTFVDLLPRPASSGDPLGCAGKRETAERGSLKADIDDSRRQIRPAKRAAKRSSQRGSHCGRLAGGSLASQSRSQRGRRRTNAATICITCPADLRLRSISPLTNRLRRCAYSSGKDVASWHPDERHEPRDPSNYGEV